MVQSHSAGFTIHSNHGQLDLSLAVPNSTTVLNLLSFFDLCFFQCYFYLQTFGRCNILTMCMIMLYCN